jgi:L-ribulose-5-phosphate 4-epimerase
MATKHPLPETRLSYAPQRRSLADAAASLLRAGVMSHSGHANLSARAGGDTILLTARAQIHDLGPADLALVRLDGSVAEGRLTATSAEIVAMHTAVYLARPEAGAVIHTHSPALLAFALAGRPLPVRYEALLRFGQAEEVPVAAWAPRGSARSAGAITDLLRQRPGTHAVLLANHGVLAFGTDTAHTVSLVTVLEEAAEGELAAAALGGAADFPAGALTAVRAAMARTRAGHRPGQRLDQA